MNSNGRYLANVKQIAIVIVTATHYPCVTFMDFTEKNNWKLHNSLTYIFLILFMLNIKGKFIRPKQKLGLVCSKLQNILKNYK